MDSSNEISVCGCGIEFTQKKNLYAHMRKMHEIEPLMSNKTEKKFLCKTCYKRFSCQSSLTRHIRIFHRAESELLNSTGIVRKMRLICPYDTCNVELSNYENLRQHLIKSHGIEVECEILTFDSIADFKTWKEDIQQKTSSLFTKDTGNKPLKSGVTRIFMNCHRSYSYHSKGNNIRIPKSIATNKIGKACPSRLEVTIKQKPVNEPVVSVKYWKTHWGHTTEDGRKPSKKKIRLKTSHSKKHEQHQQYFHPTLQQLQESTTTTTVEAHNIMYPIFLLDNDDAIEPVSGMPNVFQYGINTLLPELEELVNKGLKSILIFGIIDTLKKDSKGSNADSEQSPVVRAVPKIREAFPTLLIACDVCLCPYTSHGHCGVLNSDGAVDNVLSAKRIAKVALAYAKAGAHVLAPSDMMDNRIKTIKDALISAKLQNQVSVMSCSCRFTSLLYGSFQESNSYPIEGNRKCYQLPPGSADLAAMAAEQDVDEGADFLMVKPGLPYLDIVKQNKDRFPNNLHFIYQVSGEYAMISKNGDDAEVLTTLMETLTCMRRAGADCIITYFAPLILDIISD